MAKNDPHRQRVIIDTAEWWARLEQLAEMRRVADTAPTRPAAALHTTGPTTTNK